MLTAEQVTREAAESGFRLESTEKVARLLEVLSGLQRHPHLKTRLALKGGTALNLFVLDVPRAFHANRTPVPRPSSAAPDGPPRARSTDARPAARTTRRRKAPDHRCAPAPRRQTPRQSAPISGRRAVLIRFGA
jgi:hypothetical protein